jgi:hypothetical protein
MRPNMWRTRGRAPASAWQRAAVLLAWLAGFAGTASGSPARPRRRTWPELGVAVSHMTADPLGILRAGLAMPLTGFAVLVFLR